MNLENFAFIEDDTLYTNHYFNEPLNDEHYKMMEQIKHIVFGNCFNQNIEIKPNILTIQFSKMYNKSIILTPNLISLTLGNCFNTYLVLGPCMKHLSFLSCELYIIDQSMHLYLNKNLIFLKYCLQNYHTFRSSKYLEELHLNKHFGEIIFNCCIKKVILGCAFDRTIDLTKNILIMDFGYNFNQLVKLNKNMRSVVFGNKFNCRIILPKYLVNLAIKSCYNYPIILSPHIKKLCLEHLISEHMLIEHSKSEIHLWISDIFMVESVNYNMIDSLPNSLKNLFSNFIDRKTLINLPSTTRVIKIKKDWKQSMLQGFNC